MTATVLPRIDALLFDLGGVLIDVDFDRAFQFWSRHSAVAAPVLRERFSVDEHYRRHECGHISGAEYFSGLRNTLGIDLTDVVFEEGWNAILGDEITGMATLLPQLQAQAPLYLFSNSNATHQQQWATRFAPLLGNFQQQFVSSDIGLRKPDAEAFLHVARAIGVAPAHILFFDDLEENVLGARRAGLAAVQVKSVDCVKSAVQSYWR